MPSLYDTFFANWFRKQEAKITAASQRVLLYGCEIAKYSQIPRVRSPEWSVLLKERAIEQQMRHGIQVRNCLGAHSERVLNTEVCIREPCPARVESSDPNTRVLPKKWPPPILLPGVLKRAQMRFCVNSVMKIKRKKNNRSAPTFYAIS